MQGLPTELNSGTNFIPNLVLGENTGPVVTDQTFDHVPIYDALPATEFDMMPANEVWNFDWMMDTEMNDFSV